MLDFSFSAEETENAEPLLDDANLKAFLDRNDDGDNGTVTVTEEETVRTVSIDASVRGAFFEGLCIDRVVGPRENLVNE
ncbi:hypothetical protein HDU83_001072 [Entophlyctis luteolus]|nr:hypothetical protein HDU83_001072 [Entophlyctis luteolus]